MNSEPTICHICGGTGLHPWRNDTCPMCQGTGELTDEVFDDRYKMAAHRADRYWFDSSF